MQRPLSVGVVQRWMTYSGLAHDHKLHNLMLQYCCCFTTYQLNTAMQAWRQNAESRPQEAFDNLWEQTVDVRIWGCKAHCMQATAWLTAVIKIARLYGWLFYPVVWIKWTVFVAWLCVLAWCATCIDLCMVTWSWYYKWQTVAEAWQRVKFIALTSGPLWQCSCLHGLHEYSRQQCYYMVCKNKAFSYLQTNWTGEVYKEYEVHKDKIFCKA